MDYKYIEQLLERYWECQTTLEEEAILRKFFAQEDIPASLLPYRDVFLAEEVTAGEHLGEDFDQRLMDAIGQKQSARAARMNTAQLLRPLYRAVALVAIVLTIGMAAQQGFDNHEAGEPAYAELVGADTTVLTTEPQPLEQTEAVLTTPQSDTLIIMNP